MEIFCRNNGYADATADESRMIKMLRCTCRGWPWPDEEEGEDTALLCALHQLGDDDVPPGMEGYHWPWPRKGSWVTEVVVPRPRVDGGAAFAGYVRWRRAVTMRTRFFLEHYYGKA